MSASSGTIPRPPLDIDSEDTTTKKATTEMKASPGHRSLFSRVSTFGSDLVNALGDGLTSASRVYSFYSSSGEFVVYLSFTSSRAALKKSKNRFQRARARRGDSLSPSLFLSSKTIKVVFVSRVVFSVVVVAYARRRGVYSQSCFSFFLQNRDTKKTPKIKI